ncbi:MAG: hypothetical protein DSY55_01780 [Clostridia bacterium]|nr:MAG: hypothetical protein DSY55_01780 [Clostridia bacterium]
MWKSLLDNMDDFDLKRVVDLVDAFWDDREKIVTSTNMVWENRERFIDSLEYVSDNRDRIDDIVDFINKNRHYIIEAMDFIRKNSHHLEEVMAFLKANRSHLDDVVQFINENREQVTHFVEHLPDILDNAGESIVAAGEGAVRASTWLTGSDPNDDALSAYELTAMAAMALERCNLQLENVAAMLQTLGHQVDDIHIPAIEPRYTEVMGFHVVTGIHITESALADNAADHFTASADRLSDIGDDFSNAAGQLRRLGSSLTQAGDKLTTVGSQLQRSGGVMRSISEKTAGSRAQIIEIEAPQLDIKHQQAFEKKMEGEIKALQKEVAKLRKQRKAQDKKLKALKAKKAKKATKTPSRKKSAAKK